MHDIVNLEALGVPGVFVASSEFVIAAETQAIAIGANPARVFVPHPIQDRADSEIAMLAEAALDAIIAEIIRG